MRQPERSTTEATVAEPPPDCHRRLVDVLVRVALAELRRPRVDVTVPPANDNASPTAVASRPR